MVNDAEVTTNGQKPWSYEDTPDRQIDVLVAASKLEDRTIAPEKLERSPLVERHATNLEAYKDKKLPSNVKQIILPFSYPPSSTPFKELKQIHLSDLKLETHHWGGYLVGKAIVDPFVYGCVISVIEDERGNCGTLTVFNQDDNLLDTLIPCDAIVAVKEPYCKFNNDNDFVIRVDHPSDIHIWRAGDDRIPGGLDAFQDKKSLTAQEWKASGDKAFLGKKYLESISCYSRALSASSSDNKEFRSDVLYRRASVFLALKRFDSAKEDALASLIGTAQDKRAYQCAARAAYETNLFKESKSYLEKGLEFDANNAALRKELSRAEQRINEETKGEYDFRAMTSSVSMDSNDLDNTSYFGPAEVRQTPNYGRGLFATRDIEPGELVLCEKAYLLPNKYGKRHDWEDGIFNIMHGFDKTLFSTGATLLGGIITKLYNNPSLNATYLSMYEGDYKRSGKEGNVIDGVPVVDIFLVESIRVKNCFSSPLISSIDNPYSNPGDSMPVSTGIWIACALSNHACVPNTIRSFIGTHQIVRSTCRIPKDAQIHNQYIKPEADLDSRQEAFRGGWGFDCDCWLCTGESASPLPIRQKRNAVFEQIRKEAMDNSKPGKMVSASMVRKVEKMTRQLELLFEPDVFEKLPRLLLVQPSLWLTEQCLARKEYLKMQKHALATMRSFGFMDPLWDENKRLKFDNALVNIESVRLMHYASEAYGHLGNVEMQTRFKEEARLGFLMITGSDTGRENLETILSAPINRR